MPDNDIRKMYQDSQKLTKDSHALTEELAKFNPGIKANGRKSLATLASDAGALAYHYTKLRVDIVNMHERKQRNGASTKTI